MGTPPQHAARFLGSSWRVGVGREEGEVLRGAPCADSRPLAFPSLIAKAATHIIHVN